MERLPDPLTPAKFRTERKAALNPARPRAGLEPSTVKLPLPQVFPVVPSWDRERDHHLESLRWGVWGAHGDTREPLGLGTVKAEEAPFHVTS